MLKKIMTIARTIILGVLIVSMTGSELRATELSELQSIEKELEAKIVQLTNQQMQEMKEVKPVQDAALIKQDPDLIAFMAKAKAILRKWELEYRQATVSKTAPLFETVNDKKERLNTLKQIASDMARNQIISAAVKSNLAIGPYGINVQIGEDGQFYMKAESLRFNIKHSDVSISVDDESKIEVKGTPGFKTQKSIDSVRAELAKYKKWIEEKQSIKSGTRQGTISGIQSPDTTAGLAI